MEHPLSPGVLGYGRLFPLPVPGALTLTGHFPARCHTTSRGSLWQ
jgi:hypothetical protein